VCLQKDPRQRYASAEQLADCLRLFLDGKAIPDRPRRWPVKVWRTVCCRPRLSAAILFVGLLAVSVLLMPPWTRIDGGRPEVENGPNPDQERRQVEDRLAQGLLYEFRGDEPVPGPFRWMIGPAVPLKTDTDNGCVSVPLTTGLLEVVADPGCDRYRFTVDVRHDDWASNSRVGLFFGRRRHHPAGGVPQDSFYTLTFADRGDMARHARKPPNGEPVAWVRLQTHVFEPGLVKTPTPQPMMVAGREREFQPALPLVGPAPWRTLQIEVSPERVQTFWRNDRGALERINPEGLSVNELEERMAQGKKLHVPTMVGVPLGFRPRSGLGLYIYRGAASFRRLVIEPRPGGG
jgi:hypothetical protein